MLEIVSKSSGATLRSAGALAKSLQGGEVIELIGDLGAGKTVFVRGLARGLKSQDVVQSPSFMISRVYGGRDGLSIYHFDFHRLHDAGVVGQELAEVLHDPKAIVVTEWSDIVRNVLPADRLTVNITAGAGEDERILKLSAHGAKHQRLLKGLR